MTPHWLTWLQPLVEVACFVLLWLSLDRRKYPATLIYLPTEAIWHALNAAGYWRLLYYGDLQRTALRVLVVVEIFRAARVYIEASRLRVILCAVLELSLLASGVLSAAVGLTPLQSMLSFRQNVNIALAIVMLGLCLGAWPTLQARDRARDLIRWGVCSWMVVLALGGLVINRGIAWQILHITERQREHVYDVTQVATFGILSLTIGLMGLGVAWIHYRPLVMAVRLDRRRRRQIARKPMGVATELRARKIA